MVRDITTTYNVWNIDEKIQKIADAGPGQIKNFLKARKSQLQSTIRLSKKSSLYAMTTVLWLQPM
jgi:hypothetical protein